MIKLIIFDFDGVIINEYAKHYEFTKKRIKGLTEEEFKMLFDGNFREQFIKFKKRSTGLHSSDYNDYKKTLKIASNIKKSLQKLAKVYILGIISSSKESGTQKILENSDLHKTFSFNYGSKTHTSKVEKFKKVLREYHIKPEQCIFVTDTVGDVIEARKMGIRSIAVDFGYHERKRLQKINPSKIVSSFSEIEKLL